MNSKKKISPQAILALKEALSVIYWKKDDLKDFIKLSIENKAIVGTINWSVTKRESVKELISRMTSRPEIYQNDLMNLLIGVTDFTDFSNLDYWDEDGSLRRKAEDAVKKLRTHTKGYIQLTKEEEEAKKRRIETEKEIAKNKSLQSELTQLRTRFYQIASNQNLQQRGYDLETFLYDLFMLYEMNPKGSFKNYGEQIDGAFTHEGIDYLLEAKWKAQVDRGDLASFAMKIDSKLKITMGLLVSIDGVTAQAISPEFKSMIIMDGADLSAIMEERISLPDLIYKKRRKASESGKIFTPFTEL